MSSAAYKSNNKNSGNEESWFYRMVVREKMNNPFGYVLLIAIAVLISVAISMEGMDSAVIIAAAVIGLPLAFGALFNLQFGIALTVISAFFVLWIKKFMPGNLPLGLVIDILIGVMFFGMFIQQIKLRDWSFLKSPISLFVLIWIVYNILMFANPSAQSREAWFYTVRGIAFFTVLYYIAVFAFNRMRTMELIVNLIVGLSLLAALYGLYQEFVGLPGIEMKWLRSDPRLYKLVYQWGKIRVFSFLSDPSTFGILMAYMGDFCMALSIGPFSKGRKAFLFISGSLMVFAMMFSGTRTAFVLLPAAFVFFTVLTLNRLVIFSLIVFLMVGSVVMIIPTSNPTLYRLQSAFKPQKDASMNTRLTNQKKIQPFIWSHPIGGGLGSTGFFGKRFSPGSMLAEFPPDSGFVRVAVELGWIGLFIYCSLLFVILRTGITNYVNSRNDKIRAYYLAFLVMIFAMIVSNYPQDSLSQLPTSIIFFLALAALVRMKEFDKSAGQNQKK